MLVKLGQIGIGGTIRGGGVKLAFPEVGGAGEEEGAAGDGLSLEGVSLDG